MMKMGNILITVFALIAVAVASPANAVVDPNPTYNLDEALNGAPGAGITYPRYYYILLPALHVHEVSEERTCNEDLLYKVTVLQNIIRVVAEILGLNLVGDVTGLPGYGCAFEQTTINQQKSLDN